jgi:hypothetical protein
MFGRGTARIAQLLSLGTLACVEGGNLAISAGAPVMAAVEGTISNCGKPASGAVATLLVQQDRSEQARPVNMEVEITTNRQGRYLVELGPPFAVPGPADIQLQVSGAGISLEVVGALDLSLGHPPRDTARLDADLGRHGPSC